MNFKTQRTKCLSLKMSISTKTYIASFALIQEMYPYRNTEFNLSFINYIYTYTPPLKTCSCLKQTLSSFKTLAEIEFYSNYSLETVLEISHRSNRLVLRHMGVKFIYIFYYPHTYRMFSFATWHKQSKIFPVSSGCQVVKVASQQHIKSDSIYVYFEIILSTTAC